MELRHCLHVELNKSLEVYRRVDEEFRVRFGRGGNPIAEKYLCDDAEYIAVALGSMANQIKDVVDRLREEGMKVGLVALSLYRPFPRAYLASELSGRKGVVVFEKALSFGSGGALFGDIQAALYESSSRPSCRNYILGLGGRNYKSSDFYDAVRESVQQGFARRESPAWIGLNR
jgi:pyruvate/2-oxoacid:ferredoxin oxidoreductase alpha subunit